MTNTHGSIHFDATHAPESFCAQADARYSFRLTADNDKVDVYITDTPEAVRNFALSLYTSAVRLIAEHEAEAEYDAKADDSLTDEDWGAACFAVAPSLYEQGYDFGPRPSSASYLGLRAQAEAIADRAPARKVDVIRTAKDVARLIDNHLGGAYDQGADDVPPEMTPEEMVAEHRGYWDSQKPAEAALDDIASALRTVGDPDDETGVQWNGDTLDAVADIVKDSGRTF